MNPTTTVILDFATVVYLLIALGLCAGIAITGIYWIAMLKRQNDELIDVVEDLSAPGPDDDNDDEDDEEGAHFPTDDGDWWKHHKGPSRN